MNRQDCFDELKWLYMELYDDEDAFSYFAEILERSAQQRKKELRDLDEKRLNDPDWYKRSDLTGMMLYVQNFGGNLKGTREKLPYLEEFGVNYLHLMPLLDSPDGKSDGGYAVADFRKVRPKLGTMEDLEALADACHEMGMALCFDFVLNHVSEEHAWAKAAVAGDPVARSRFFIYDNWDIPRMYEQTVPQVFPTTAPGNFTWRDDMGKAVMTTFHHYQWDLNYSNPMVFNDMTDNLLFLANRGMDVIRLDAIPYIWKELGTNCRNLPQVHTLVRMMHLACQIVCPGVVLLGEVVMEPREVVPYFGSEEKPECDILYNVTTMCSTWHSLATRDVRLLQHQMEQVCGLPANCLFQNYIRCHDDIGWGLDYPFLGQFGMGEVPHKRYLNDWFTGVWPGSWSRGEVYNDSESLGDARLCGTAASLCGIQAGIESGDDDLLKKGIDCDMMMHAWMLTQTGIPVIYSGDEVGQINDYSYHQDPGHWGDSRYLHRGKFNWELAERRYEKGTSQQILFDGLKKLFSVRAEQDVFRSDAQVYVYYTGDDRVMGLKRMYGDQTFIGLFNFSEHPADVSIECPVRSLRAEKAETSPDPADTGASSLVQADDPQAVPAWLDLFSGAEFRAPGMEVQDASGNGAADEPADMQPRGNMTIHMEGYGFYWLID